MFLGSCASWNWEKKEITAVRLFSSMSFLKMNSSLGEEGEEEGGGDFRSWCSLSIMSMSVVVNKVRRITFVPTLQSSKQEKAWFLFLEFKSTDSFFFFFLRLYLNFLWRQVRKKPIHPPTSLCLSLSRRTLFLNCSKPSLFYFFFPSGVPS